MVLKIAKSEAEVLSFGEDLGEALGVRAHKSGLLSAPN